MPHPPRRSIRVTFPPDTNAACIGCGYNLRGVSSDGCPECGRGFLLAGPRQVEHYGLYLFALTCAAGIFVQSIRLITELLYFVLQPASFWFDDFLSQAIHVSYALSVPYFILLIIFRKLIVRARLWARLAWCVAPTIWILIHVLLVWEEILFTFF